MTHRRHLAKSMQFWYFQENTDKGVLYEMSSSALHLTGIFGFLSFFSWTPICSSIKGSELLEPRQVTSTMSGAQTQHRLFAFTFLFIWKAGMQVHKRAEKCAIKQAAYTWCSHGNSKHFREFILEVFSQHETRECYWAIPIMQNILKSPHTYKHVPLKVLVLIFYH